MAISKITKLSCPFWHFSLLFCSLERIKVQNVLKVKRLFVSLSHIYDRPESDYIHYTIQYIGSRILYKKKTLPGQWLHLKQEGYLSSSLVDIQSSAAAIPAVVIAYCCHCHCSTVVMVRCCCRVLLSMPIIIMCCRCCLLPLLFVALAVCNGDVA